jgi:hypothetical protein
MLVGLPLVPLRRAAWLLGRTAKALIISRHINIRYVRGLVAIIVGASMAAVRTLVEQVR